MTDYLDQFSEFSRGITQSTARSTEALASGLVAAAKIKAAREQAQFESSVKMRKQASKDLYGDSFSNMYDWMQADLSAERDYIAANLGSTDTPQYQYRIADLNAGAAMYEAATSQYEGDPGDSSTSATRHGILNALNEMQQGINPYESQDRAAVDSYEDLVSDVRGKYSLLQRGKSASEQYLGGYWNEEENSWKLRFGVPGDPESVNEYTRKDLVANLEGGNAYAPSNGFKDINIPTIREVASDPKVKQFVGDDSDGYSTYFRTMISGDGLAHKRFKKSVFDEMAPDFFEKDEMGMLRNTFVSGTMDIQYDRGENKLVFNNVDPRVEKMIQSGMDRFNQSGVVVNEPASEEPDMDYNDIRFEQFDKQGAISAYDRMPRGRVEGALTSMMPGMFPAYDPDVVDGISTMTVIPSTEIGVGSDTFGKAVALGRDGRMIVKVVKETPVQLTDAQILAGISAESLPAIEAVDYMILPQELEANFYKEIGKQISPDSTDHEEVGMQYLYETYINVDQNEAPISPRAVNTQSSPPSGLVPGEPRDVEPDYSSIYPGDSAPSSEMRLIQKLTTAFGESGEAASWLEWMRESPERFNMVMGEIEKGRRPYFTTEGELIFETIG